MATAKRRIEKAIAAREHKDYPTGHVYYGWNFYTPFLCPMGGQYYGWWYDVGGQEPVYLGRSVDVALIYIEYLAGGGH